jgi:hypothetical protein
MRAPLCRLSLLPPPVITARYGPGIEVPAAIAASANVSGQEPLARATRRPCASAKRLDLSRSDCGPAVASAAWSRERRGSTKYATVASWTAASERLVAEGIYAVLGDIGDTAVPQAVAVESGAAMLAFAIPDGLQLRHALEQVRRQSGAAHSGSYP